MSKRKLMKPRTVWILDLGSFLSSIVHYTEAEVKQEKRCARLCGEQKKLFRKFRLTEIA